MIRCAVNWQYIQAHRDPTKIRFYAVKVESAEADEMWSYVQNKRNQIWLWHAIDHKSGDILAYKFGSAEDKRFLASCSQKSNTEEREATENVIHSRERVRQHMKSEKSTRKR